MSIYSEKEGPQLLVACRDDVSKWATAFCEIDEALMIAWFANAIEHSHDIRTGRGPVVLPDGSAVFVAKVG